MAHTYIWGRPTVTREPYLMLTYISWFTALRKKCSVSALRSVSQKLQGIGASYLAYIYIWGRSTETSEPYLMLMYISWFTALRKKCYVTALRSVSQKFKGIEPSYLAYAYSWGRQTETTELYLMLT